MSLKPIDLRTARRILDFSGGKDSLASLGELQLEGSGCPVQHDRRPQTRYGLLGRRGGHG